MSSVPYGPNVRAPGTLLPFKPIFCVQHSSESECSRSLVSPLTAPGS